MFSHSEIKIIKRIDSGKYPWCNDVFVVSVRKGKAALKIETYGHSLDSDKYHEIISAITLNGMPLIQSQLPACPTCAGMLATGYGVDKDNKEIKAISDAINSEFESLEKSIDNIKPLLGLLKDGVYVIADIPSYPTDGSGNFFWAVSNKLKEVTATTCTYYDMEDFGAVDGLPIFLYPSQSTDRFNQERVDHYLKTVSEKSAPRAIAYHINGFINVLLDGHHKAAAAAISGNYVNCLTIFPVTCYQVLLPHTIIPRLNIYCSQFEISSDDLPLWFKKPSFEKIKLSTKQISDGDIIKRKWEQHYLSSARSFPDVKEIAAQKINKIHEITDALIDECYSCITSDSSKKLRFIITVLNRKNDNRCRSIALKCAKLKIQSPQLRNIEPQYFNCLREAAFKVLVRIKDDQEIEQFFIEFLIDDEEKHEVLKKIANSYWDGAKR